MPASSAQSSLQAHIDRLLPRQRHAYARVEVDGDGLVLECSDRDTSDRLLAALATAAPGLAIHAAVLPAAGLAGTCAWVTASVADARARPAHTAEQVTQALLGESAQPLLRRDGWVLARLHDGYVAWLREWHVTFVAAAVPGDFTARCNASIDVPVAALLDAPAGEAFAEAPFGTRVIASPAASGWAQVEIPGQRSGWVPAVQLRSGVPPWPCRADAVLATLRRFGGVPYVWGGKSPKGFDCSGLVQFTYGLHGVDLPRDSDEQFEAGHAVSRIAPGDLLFFGRESIGHVGVALSEHEFIHARGLVRRNSLSAASPCHDPALAEIYRGARRVLPQEPASRRSA